MTQLASSARRPRARRAAVFACIAIVAIVLDQLTKLWALTALSDGRTVPVLGSLLRLTLVFNPGASLGFLASHTWIIALFAIAACIVLIVLAWRTTSMLWTVFLSLAFAGAFGNLIDRVINATDVLNGAVVDFLNYGWSVGNVADIELMVAGIGIVLMILCNVKFSDAHEVNGTADTSEQTQSNQAASTK
ncbi:peptidase A8 [Bifidobacterium dolichotidis]|uniref:Lipoprotein signal peptidase n=1 Tax=Bifidobacterium dolichotidis TaxID=2306976 RepID=A0A430FS08_9BIFI|nr:signal peptidase II [Bifidobacterium dolichotidis]RSX55666.1 peptidase A8 [Bifidobacterium dolichotidis]